MTEPDTMTVRVDRTTVHRKAGGWTLPFLSPDVQACTTNHIPDYDGPACTDTAVWKVAQLHPSLHATIGFWCDTHLPAEQRPGAADAEPADACRVVEVDGEPIRVRSAGEMTEQDHAALAEVIAAARRKHAAEHPEAMTAADVVAYCTPDDVLTCIPCGKDIPGAVALADNDLPDGGLCGICDVDVYAAAEAAPDRS